MTRNRRIGLIVAALAVAVLAFVIASPGGDDESDNAARTTQATTANETQAQTQTEAQTAPQPEAHRIEIRGGELVGGPQDIKVKNGDTVLIVVSADASDDIHLHGYDIEKKVEPGQPARFKFKANLEGQFEMESHKAEDEGREPLLATLIVEPR
jgi:plastocyanin